MPPNTAPTARNGVVPRSSSDSPLTAFFPMLQQDMAMTVQPDRKVTVATDMTPVASSTGLMMMPPPMPQMVPRIQAPKVTR